MENTKYIIFQCICIKRQIRGLLLLLFMSFCVNYLYATTCTGTGSNSSWDNTGTWSCGHVPGCGDTIVIASGATVSLNHGQEDYSACSPPNIVYVYGTLKLDRKSVV